MNYIAALDIETTGLDPNTDAIIEVGVYIFKGRRQETEYSTLINPHRHIPDFITNLTGINDPMVRNAPNISDVLSELTNLVGDLPILGHNIKFDLSFFDKYGLFKSNNRIDTYELAAVLLPMASRYNLGALGLQLGIPLHASHRALDDARVTAAVYQNLLNKIHELPLVLLAEIVRLCEGVDWDGAWVFQQVLRSRSREKKNGEFPSPGNTWQLFQSPRKINEGKTPSLSIPDELISIDTDETSSTLEPGGPFSGYFKNYEHRPEQVEMLRAVTSSLSGGQHLLVEAGTGVGKSFAYLIPAAIFAIKNNTRILISTNTINLQDQLIKKDIPDLKTALGLDLHASVLKGRSNYLCPRRLDLMRRRKPISADELRVLAKVMVWLLDNKSGDRTEINITGSSEREVWNHLSAEDDACSNEICMDRAGGACPLFLARQAAQNAHILVVNHALLLSDVAFGNRILPDYQHLILDEGHHLEAATTSALGFHLTQWDLELLVREAGGANSGLFGQLINSTRDSISPSDFALLTKKVDRATDLAWRFQEQIRLFFDTISTFISQIRDKNENNGYPWQERILPATRTQPGWDDVESAWNEAGETLNQFLILIGELQKHCADLYSSGTTILEDLIGNLGNLYRRLYEVENMVGAMVFNPTQDTVYWLDVLPNSNRISLNSAPIHIGSLLEKYLWHEKRSIILTSATLSTHGEFNYIRNTLSADEADELILGSPFDFENAALLYIPNDISEPHTSEYQRQVENSLVNLCAACGGKTMVLFTSYAQLKRTSRIISDPLSKKNIVVYEQGDGASPNALLESFKSSDRAILLGTRSFWEGIDVPGEALSVLVIVKLPFSVPTEPLVSARSETYEDPFNEFHLPEAILRFRQGFGRLIRTQSDRGVVAILDRRLLSKTYGQAFLKSLPPCTRRIGPLVDLPRNASTWLGV